MSELIATRLPSELFNLLHEYLTEHRDSKYNNRRNKLRAMADYLFGMLDEDHKRLTNDKIESISVSEVHGKETLRPTFNSYRAHLNPVGLESFVFSSVRALMDSNANTILFHDVCDWISSSRCSFDARSSTWGLTTRLIDDLSEDLLNVSKAVMDQMANRDDADKETKDDTNMNVSTGIKIELDASHKVAVDAILGLSLGGLSVDGINSQMEELMREANDAKDKAASVTKMAAAMASAPASVAASSDGDLPEGKMVMRNAGDVFVEMPDEFRKTGLNFDVPTFEWDGDHRDVPTVDMNYEYGGTALYRVLQGIVDGNNTYLFGHTGTGKSTLVEQVCARLRFPLVRVNFDSEISRMDLVGRDVLTTDENGQTISKFVDGVLPDALSRPCLLLCDEVDFIRPDVMYVFQRVLEGNGLLISEDGGRKVLANPWFRLVATANTCGQGDESGMYMGARPQSMATLDRFENWVSVDYMESAKETKWLKSVSPLLTDDAAKMMVGYAQEHRQAFVGGKVMQPLSPRGLKAMAKRYVTTLNLTNDVDGSFKEAFGSTILDRCTSQDKVVLEGLYQRVGKL